MTDFANYINDTLTATGWSDQKLSDLLDVSIPTILRWKSGKNAPHEYMIPGIKSCIEYWRNIQNNNGDSNETT